MDAFIGEIRMMGFGITPRGWLPCAGQLLAVSSNQALFSLLGTAYGGNGVQTFGLPDLRGRVTLGYGPGQQNYNMGQAAGSESVTLTATQMPAHSHALTGTLRATLSPTGADPGGSYPSQSTATQYSTGTGNANMSGAALSGSMGVAGGSQPHENRQPVLAMNYCICTQGYFPSRG
ncbi:tail fiber protein [Hymenobacter arcticus]